MQIYTQVTEFPATLQGNVTLLFAKLTQSPQIRQLPSNKYFIGICNAKESLFYAFTKDGTLLKLEKPQAEQVDQTVASNSSLQAIQRSIRSCFLQIDNVQKKNQQFMQKLKDQNTTIYKLNMATHMLKVIKSATSIQSKISPFLDKQSRKTKIGVSLKNNTSFALVSDWKGMQLFHLMIVILQIIYDERKSKQLCFSFVIHELLPNQTWDNTVPVDIARYETITAKLYLLYSSEYTRKQGNQLLKTKVFSISNCTTRAQVLRFRLVDRNDSNSSKITIF